MVPISKMEPRSFVTNIKAGDVQDGRADARARHRIRRLYRREAVDISLDGGKSWQPTKLGQDEGKYSFRQWQTEIAPPAGPVSVMVRCTNSDGLAQPKTMNWNPSGFMHNAIETLNMTAA